MEDLKKRQLFFGEVFLEQYLWLHRKFSLGLLSVRVEKEAVIDDLIQETGKQAWENYCKPQHAHKSIVYLLRQKAKNVLSDYYAAQKKNLVPLDEMTVNISIPSFGRAYEARNMLDYLQENGDGFCFLVCQLMDGGYSYNEIEIMLNLPKSTKMKVCRYRKKLKGTDLDPF